MPHEVPVTLEDGPAARDADRPAPAAPGQGGDRRLVWRFVGRRLLLGLLTLVLVSIVIFLATEVLPGNAAYAALGHTASPARVKVMEQQLHLNDPLWKQYGRWFSGLIRGNLGNSLINGKSVWSQLSMRVVNSAFLILLAGVIGTLLGAVVGAVAAVRRQGILDHVLSVGTLAVLSMPEFVVAILVVLLLATKVTHLLPAVAIFPPGANAWDRPQYCILPILTMVLVVLPYVSRATRAAVIESLESDYVEYAILKGVPHWKVLTRDVLPNAMGPVIQVVGLILLYLAGGIVVVEYVYAFPGIGQGLVNAVNDRDIPTIQATVLLLAVFYIIVNIVVDAVSLVASPRRRLGQA